MTVGLIRGRARGVGSEFLLALDMRFASRERAILCQPEIGFGFVPGGGGLERLPLVTGRSRAMEIVVGGEDFDADTAERYGWVNRSVPDAELDSFVERLASRIAGFDRQAVITAKKILNQRGRVAQGTDQLETFKTFVGLLQSPSAQHKISELLELGLQQRSDTSNVDCHLTLLPQVHCTITIKCLIQESAFIGVQAANNHGFPRRAPTLQSN